MIVVIVRRKIKPGKHSQYHEVVASVKQKAQLQEGYMGGEILVNREQPDELLVISRWDSKEHWDAWVVSTDRQAFMNTINDVLSQQESIEFFEPKGV